MKQLILLLACCVMLFSPTASALTELHQVTSEKDCPANLKLRVEPSEANLELLVVSVMLAPRAPQAYADRVKAFGHLQMVRNGGTVFDAALELTKKADGFHCRFRIHADFLKQSHLTLSTRLYERDGHPTLGGGEIYEISLRGFAPSATVKPNPN